VYYYYPISIRVKTSGTYTLKSSSTFDAYGSLYQTNFDPSSVSENRISGDDDSAGDGQFQLTEYLNSNLKYVLVFTTFRPNIKGQFFVIASGPGTVSLI
jgi:hypothetical protein